MISLIVAVFVFILFVCTCSLLAALVTGLINGVMISIGTSPSIDYWTVLIIVVILLGIMGLSKEK
jgi:hypothetical protein